ncbi:MAG: hypothetical protein ACSNEK_04890 [Parachlamydiaceae bacterium]
MDGIDALVLGKNAYEVVSCRDERAYKSKRVIGLSHPLKQTREEAGLFCEQLTKLVSKRLSENIRQDMKIGSSCR